MRVQPRVFHRLLRLVRRDARRLAHVLQPERDRPPDDVRQIEIAVLVLEARRRRRLKGVRSRRVGVHDAADEVQPEIGRLPEHDGARLTVLRLKLKIGGRQDVVPLAEEIQTPGEVEHQVLGRRRHHIHFGGRRAQDAPHVLSVLELGEGRQRIRRRERVSRVHPVHRPQIHEARRRRIDKVRAGPRVIVVRDAAIRQAVDRVQVDADLEPAAQELVQVRPDRLLLVAGVLGDPPVLLHETRQKIGRLIVPAGDGGVGLDGQLVLSVKRALIVEDRAPAARQGTETCGVWSESRRRFGDATEATEAEGVRQGGSPEALGDAEAWRARTTAPCGDHEYAIRRLRPVDRRRGRAFQHFDALNVVGV